MRLHSFDNTRHGASCRHCDNSAWVIVDAPMIKPDVQMSDDEAWIVVKWQIGDGLGERHRTFAAGSREQVEASAQLVKALQRTPMVESMRPCPACLRGFSAAGSLEPGERWTIDQAMSVSWNTGMRLEDVRACRSAGCYRPARGEGIRCVPCERSYQARQRGIDPMRAGLEYARRAGIVINTGGRT